nr:response regulator [Micromonospora sp. DSM 115978]
MIRVLVVDDDFMVAKVHRGYVERIPGFTVAGVAHTGTGALAEVARLKPDLVLLDIYLPDISGLEVLRKLRNGAATVDVLAVTAARDVETIRSALRTGVVHYLIKPFTFDTLRDRLERYAVAHRGLAGSGEVGQADVDRILVTLRSTRHGLPKGLTEPTADLVLGALRDADSGLSATECADQVGLSRVSTRRYLEHFVDTGRATVSLRYGSAGRPERQYRSTGGA